MRAILSNFLIVVVPLTVAFQEYAVMPPPPLPITLHIVPGTKWCGPGNISTSYDDLGKFTATDRCCRAHDHCPEVMEAGTSLHGLKNPDIFPRLSCTCEEELLKCLQSAKDVISKVVGRVYFCARSQCFKLAFPAVGCLEYQRAVVRKRCIKYKFEQQKAMEWQFFDMPFHKKK